MPVPHGDLVDAALTCASTLVGMEVVLLLGMDGDEACFARVRGPADWPGVAEGVSVPRADTLCARMLAGAPRRTTDAARDFADAALRERLGIVSYVGVPVYDRTGRLVGTLCGIDRGEVPVSDAVVGVLEELAGIVGARLAAPSETVIRRTPTGWRVGETDDEDDLVSAMVLADLLADDLDPGSRPPKAEQAADETARLRTAVVQLEHALAARVVVEQAIGVLSERLRTAPREAFELLRKVARRGGVRVHDLSRSVVGSTTDAAVVLPAELARR